jgi:NADH dehydrogenase [ubiquinone] 1 alpha subcomplex assembly factor 1
MSHDIRALGTSRCVVVDFANVDEVRAWAPIDDVVMGGASSSTLTPSGFGTAFFAGHVSRENGGGFASVRSPNARRQLSGKRGLRVRFRSDGQRYRLRVRTSESLDGIVYQASFAGERGVWSTVDLPFQDFVPVFRGAFVPGVEPLDPSSIVSFGLLIAREEAGSFRLELSRLEAF